MIPHTNKFLASATAIATELDRQGFMFEHGLAEAAALEDMDVHNARVMYRDSRQRRNKFAHEYRLNVYACRLGLDISHNFYQNMHRYEKPLYTIRKGENLYARLTGSTTGTDFQ